MWRGERQTIKLLREQVDPTAKYVWFHAASLGEFEQGRPLMERLRELHPEYKILLTFFSPSGYEVRKDYKGADIVTYLPIDTVGNARRFLRTVRPVMAFFVKYEFWYNYLHILNHRGVPTYSVSSIFRPGQIFFRPYGRQYGRVLRCFSRFFVQNEESSQLLSSIGIDQVEVATLPPIPSGNSSSLLMSSRRSTWRRSASCCKARRWPATPSRARRPWPMLTS